MLAAGRPLGAPPARAARAPRRARAPLRVAAAKKGGGAQKKAPGLLAGRPPPAPYAAGPVVVQSLLLLESYARRAGAPLLPAEEGAEPDIALAARALWEAPTPILAHDCGAPGDAAGPRFVYANAAACALFETTFAEIVGTPSAASVGDPATSEEVAAAAAERAALLAKVEADGVAHDYSGWRVSFRGTRFRVADASVWNVGAPSGARVGQAAALRGWEFADGRRGGSLAEPAEPAAANAYGGAAVFEAASPGSGAGAEALAEAEAAAAAAAAAVRALKECHGLGNGDAEVQAAVGALLAAKAALAALKG
jgi:hypothetical protein